MRRTWPRRPLLIYAAAVVGPTIVVMVTGLSAVRRQYEALEALRATNSRLQEARFEDELERTLFAAASNALDELTSRDLFHALTARDLTEVDGARTEIEVLRRRHPIIETVFVAGEGTVLHPRTDPSLPRTIAETLADEVGPSRGEVRRLIEAAQRIQAAEAVTAAHLYDTAARQATSRTARALAIAGAALTHARRGGTSEATRAWLTLATDFADVYSPTGRPYGLIAALELTSAPDHVLVVHDIRDSLLSGRWTVTPDHADYVLARLLGAQERPDTPYLRTLGFARRLRALLPGGPVMTSAGVSWASLAAADRVEQIYFVADPMRQRLAGFSMDLEWVRSVLVPALAADLSPDATLNLEAREPHQAGFRPQTRAWRLSVATEGTLGWRGLDVVVFAAGTAVVLGVLCMGVVLLMRDVARETDLNRMRADLASGVSHELKTPLSVIRIHAETIDETPAMTAAERRHFTAAIVQETERLRRLVDDVVDFSRIQQGQRFYRLRPGSLVPIVREAVEAFRIYAELHGYDVRSDIDDAVPAAIFDPAAVKQAVLNLLDNAVKYSGDATEVHVRLSISSGHIVIEVKDHGVGIASGEQARIFERFYRGADSSRGGYGLGLYLVRHVMEAHGGRVDVSSNVGSGSCFRLFFPHAPHGAQADRHGEGVAG